MTKEELDELREEYNKEAKEEVKNPSLKRKREEIIDPNDRSWRNIHFNFTSELVKEWQKYGFSYEQIQD
jgi:hypothetical protein